MQTEITREEFEKHVGFQLLDWQWAWAKTMFGGRDMQPVANGVEFKRTQLELSQHRGSDLLLRRVEWAQARGHSGH